MPDCVFFDLDNTLIGGDSDYLWGEFLADSGAVPAQEHRDKNRYYMAQYQCGELDPEEFLTFQLYPLSLHPISDLEKLRATYLETVIKPLLLPKAISLLTRHRSKGDQLILATSTNSFITRPIADILNIKYLIAAQPEIAAGKFTGRLCGQPSYGAAKLDQAKIWLCKHNGSLTRSWFYSDSHTDLPLLEAVGYPVAVDPDEKLLAIAKASNWPCLSLR